MARGFRRSPSSFQRRTAIPARGIPDSRKLPGKLLTSARELGIFKRFDKSRTTCVLYSRDLPSDFPAELPDSQERNPGEIAEGKASS
jgi:hypothetical protein